MFMLKRIINQLNYHSIWTERGFSFFARKLPLLNFRRYYLLPTIIVSDNLYQADSPTIIVVEVRWLCYAIGIKWIKDVHP